MSTLHPQHVIVGSLYHVQSESIGDMDISSTKWGSTRSHVRNNGALFVRVDASPYIGARAGEEHRKRVGICGKFSRHDDSSDTAFSALDGKKRLALADSSFHPPTRRVAHG